MLSELQKFTTISKYARHLDDENRREVWNETVDRYKGMLLKEYPARAREIEEACSYIYDFRVMPSMRALQFGGYPIEKRNARLYNCTSSHVDRLRFFPETMYLLLCGCGTGFSVQSCHIQYLPNFSYDRLRRINLPRKSYTVEDSIEGWANAHACLLSSYHEKPIRGFEEYMDCEVDFDFGLVSPKGCPLSFGMGLTPGPEPLVLSIMRCRQLLIRAIENKQNKLSSINAFDYVNHMADAVLSGGVRRSATICLFDKDDEEMTHSKTGNWYKDNPQRARANISAVLLRDETSFTEFSDLFEATKQFGEPGFYWSGNKDICPNPCVEIALYPKLKITDANKDLLEDYDGPIVDGYVSGWQMCNLCTINGRTTDSAEEFYRRCCVAAKLGTWQAGFARFPYLGSITEAIVRREALLGVSICGMMHQPAIFLNEEYLKNGAEIVKRTNKEEASAIGINAAARTTCVKPDGNSASALGSFSGCHPGKFHKGFRIVQVNKDEAPYQLFKNMNPDACEHSMWSANDTDDVIRFPVEYEGILEQDLTATQFLSYVKLIQNSWVKTGKNANLCVVDCSHNVSNTVRVRDSEWDEVKQYIYDNKAHFSGVSLIGWSGDKDYAQAPFTTVYNEAEQEKYYGKIEKELLELILTQAEKYDNLWHACNSVLSYVDDGESFGITYFHGLVHFLAHRHFDYDIVKATYCIKDYYNWKLYQKLKSSFQPVDYRYMWEKRAHNLAEDIACSGGQCET